MMLLARARPILRPWQLILKGRWKRCQGRHLAGRLALQQAIRSARRMNLTFEASVAETELNLR